MKKLIVSILAAVFLATPAFAEWEPGSGSQVTETLNAIGGIAVGKTLGPELLTQTCAGWGLTTPVGAWSCTGDTITRTASGSNLTITNTAAVAGDEYELVLTAATVTASTVTMSAGGVSCVAVSAARTQTCRVAAGATTAVTLTATATFAGTITVSTTSAKKVISEVSSSDGPLVFDATLSSATENEAAMKLNYVVSKTAGNDTGLQVNMIDQVSGGTSNLFDFTVAGSSRGRLTADGEFWPVNITTTQLNTAAAAAYSSGSGTTFTSWGSVYKSGNTVGVMNGSDTLNIFDAAITNSDHTGADNYVNAFKAGDITGDPSATEAAIRVGTGWDRILDSASYDIGTGSVWQSPPSTSVLTGSIDPTASTTLTGVGTIFTQQLMVGDKITVSGETRTVTAIASDTSLTVDTATTDTANDTSVDRYPVGLSITAADSSVGTDIFVNPAVKTSGSLMDLRVGGASKFSVTSGGGAVASAVVYTPVYKNLAGDLSTTPLILGGGTSTATSGSIVSSKVSSIYNQASGTAANTDLLISRTETALGSGAQKFLSLQGGAAGTTEYYSIGNRGLQSTTPQAVTCADDAAGTNAAVTITPTSSYVEITQSDATGCDITMGETGMVVGNVVTICNVSVTGATKVNFADSAGVSELAGAFASDVDDCITLRYGNTTTWREVSRSAN